MKLLINSSGVLKQRVKGLVKKKQSLEAASSGSLLAASFKDGSGSPDSALTTGFIKNDRFKTNLKSRDGVCLTNPNWELVSNESSMISEGSASH